MPGSYRFAIDRGGTFTDVVAETPAGALVTAKLLSSDPVHYADAASEAVRRIVAEHGPAPIAELRIGTTVATNALLERKGARVALAITAGHAERWPSATRRVPASVKQFVWSDDFITGRARFSDFYRPFPQSSRGSNGGDRSVLNDRSISASRLTMPWEKQFDVGQTLTRAMQAFWAHGYEATSMQDLVSATGVNRASLYATYGDKRELFFAALRKYDSEVRAATLVELAKSDDPAGAIAAVFDRFIAQADTEGANWGCFLTNSALELAPHDKEVARFVAAAQMEIEAFFRDMVANGQAAGSFPASHDPDAVGRHLLTSLLGLVVLIRSRPDPHFLKSVRDSALRLIE